MVYQAPPVVLYEEPPVVIAPAFRPRVLHMEAPEDVLARLARDGYGDLGPIDRRGALYVLTASDPKGDLVSLEISIFSGEVQRASVLEARYAAVPSRPPAAPRSPAARPAPAAAPAQPARIPAPKAETVASPVEQTDTPAAIEERPLSDESPSNTLRDRLYAPPSAPAPSENEPDPLVVY